ncbi:MAG: NAD-binding protein [Anaerolineales bacterium]|jgi:voltage-gated potassium channel Kch
MENNESAGKINFKAQSRLRLTWMAIGFLWLVGFMLGFVGLAQYAQSAGESLSPLDLAYRLLQLITLESGALSPPIPWTLEVARFGLPALAAWTVLRAAMHLFREQARRIAILFWRNHLIVAGLSRKGFHLATELAAAGRKVVVIEQDPSHRLMAACRHHGIVVLVGNATDPSELVRAQIRRAGDIIAVTGDDATNVEVAVSANRVLQDHSRPPLHCIVHIVNPSLWNLMRCWEIAQGKFDALKLELFNVYLRGADTLIDEYDIAEGPPERGTQTPSLLIVGMGRLCEHLVVQVARKWFHLRRSPDKIEIVVVDPLAAEKLDLLAVRYPALGTSAQLVPISIKPTSAAFEKGEFAAHRNFNLAVIDLPDEEESLATALTVKRFLSGSSTPVAIHMAHSEGIHRLLGTLASPRVDEPDLRPFELVERVCVRDFINQGTHEQLARALHLAYLENRRATSSWDDSDPALVRWEMLPHAIQESNRAQADFIGKLLREAGYDLTLLADWSLPPYHFDEQTIEDLAHHEHDRWRDEKQQQGWRYAPGPKSEVNKTNPALLAWVELPEDEKEKNRVFVRSWPVILHQAGFKIVPMQIGE